MQFLSRLQSVRRMSEWRRPPIRTPMPIPTSSSFATWRSTCAPISRRIASKARAELTVEQINPYANELTLDTRDLEIRTVHLVESDGTTKVLAFRLAERDPVLGSKLTIDFPHCCEPTQPMRIRIDYRTSARQRAAVARARADFGDAPFVYSQGQAIHTRSWIPLQDTPAVRVTYSARIRTPPELVAVMSAARLETSSRRRYTASR